MAGRETLNFVIMVRIHSPLPDIFRALSLTRTRPQWLMYEVLISDGTFHSSLSLYILWGTGLHGVVISLARRKTDEFDSRVLHQREVFLVLLGYY